MAENEQKGATIVGEIFDRMSALLRYIAPGYVAILVAGFVRDIDLKNISDNSCIFWAIVVIGILSGVLVYAIHMCILTRIVWCPMFFWLMQFSPFKKHCPYRGTEKAFALSILLDEQRWLRRFSKKPEDKAIQKELDNWGAMQSFLYCSSYAMLLTPILLNWILNDPVLWGDILRFGFMGIIVLFLALISDFRHANRELWANQRYPQTISSK